MKLVTAADMREMDRKTMQNISSTQLMYQAANSVYDVLCETVQKHKKVLIICGTGNNGGDGYALALLAHQFYDVYLLSLKQPTSEDALYYYHKVVDEKITMLHELPTLDAYEVIIDALFGTGLSREITGTYKLWIEKINATHIKKLAIDLPSGIHADTGAILGCAVNADSVITFQFAKRGMYMYPGYTHCKEIIIKDIGIAACDQLAKQFITILDESLINQLLPKRLPHSHKGIYGKVLMIGGSSSMHGAITMAADSALHSGLGTLTIMLPDDIREIVSQKLLEAMIISIPSDNGFFGKEAISMLSSCIQDYDVVMIGCGMGRNKISEDLVKIVLTSNKPCVIDADGLFALSNQMRYLKRDAPIILTPHPKEFSMLTKTSVNYNLSNPITAGNLLLKQYPNVTLVMKDERRFIFHDHDIYLNTHGNNALAKGGSGDVLCGFITSIFAQSKHPLSASCCGVFLHALCAEYLVEKRSPYTILPHDLYHVLDDVFLRLTKDF